MQNCAESPTPTFVKIYMGTTYTSGYSKFWNPNIITDPLNDKITIGPFTNNELVSISDFKIFSPGATAPEPACILSIKDLLFFTIILN